MITPTISKIRIYPIKGLDPVELQETEIGIHSLKHDREWAFMAEDGRFINGKRTGLVNQLKTTFDFEKQHVCFSSRNKDDGQTFELREDNKVLLEYLSNYFGHKLKLVHGQKGELMDIPIKSSATIVSQATLESIGQDLPEHSIADLRLRFRTNLEVTGADAFWEETLFKEPGTGVRFTIGDVEFTGIAPRERCNVPPRDPFTGELDKTFVKRMMKSRATSLPAGNNLLKFGNLYHLTTDTYLAPDQQGKTIRVGDEVKVLDTVKLDGLG